MSIWKDKFIKIAFRNRFAVRKTLFLGKFSQLYEGTPWKGFSFITSFPKKDDFNLISREKAKINLKNGLDKYGKPLTK